MLYIMRHGRTDWNDARKLQGRTDIPLNETSREMARKAALEYKHINFDICFCSPLSRATETAQIVLAGRNIEIIPDDRLLEMSFGIYEGVENASEIENSPIKALFENPAEYKGAEGAETFEELFARTGDFLKNEIDPRLAQGQDILIVGHGAMNSSIVCQRRNIPLEHFWDAGIENCKLMKL